MKHGIEGNKNKIHFHKIQQKILPDNWGLLQRLVFQNF